MITPVEVIARTRDQLPLTESEIRTFILGVGDGSVEANQVAAWLMAVRLNGLSKEETVWLTQAMIDSGEVVDLSSLGGVPVDKHSTGGVGDTTTLVLAPLVAAGGGQVAKMSGRGLGHTGGTLDKMEAAGMTVNMSSERFLKQVRDIGVAVISQTAKLVPADGVLYSLRDVTATVDSVPLIASSVMSKKLACGAGAIVLDVKYGNGAFMPCLDSARDLANLMVDIGNRLGRKVMAALSPMEQPLSRYIGNALEVRKALDVLTGRRKGTPLEQVSCQLAARLLFLSGVCSDLEESEAKVKALLDSGAGAEKMKELIQAQEGDPRIVDDPELLPKAPIVRTVEMPESGYLKSLGARQLGLAALRLGAGRLRKSDRVDPSVGLVLQRRIGDRLEAGDPICEIHAADVASAAQAKTEVLKAVELSPEPVQAQQLITEWVE
jgi:pyrimidine-nucleoside phosphorylase